MKRDKNLILYCGLILSLMACVVGVVLLAVAFTFTTFEQTSPPAPPLAASVPTGIPPTHTPILATATTTNTPTPTHTPSPTPITSVRFAVIGDYGAGGEFERAVADLVKSWEPEFIITTGDNNYPNGEASTIDDNIGQFYSGFIHPYHGEYGKGADTNRFFPTLGNHDWGTDDAQPYFDYFTLPGNERYYDFQWGPAHFFALDSDSHEPDGIGVSSKQATWLKEALQSSTAPWKIVYMHHAPYTSHAYGPDPAVQWPFKDWGASVVLVGHAHVYERLTIDGFPYIINGLGGGARYAFEAPIPGSEVRYSEAHGAMLVDVNLERINFQFINVLGDVIDDYTLEAN